jgi:Alpha-L-fucosidase
MSKRCHSFPVSQPCSGVLFGPRLRRPVRSEPQVASGVGEAIADALAAHLAALELARQGRPGNPWRNVQQLQTGGAFVERRIARQTDDRQAQLILDIKNSHRPQILTTGHLQQPLRLDRRFRFGGRRGPNQRPVRADPWEKCLNLNQVTWGYNARQNLITETQLTRYLVDTVVRNGNLLLNVGPDRHGRIPATHAALLRKFGGCLHVVGDSIYGTRGGPWNPVDGQYGFTSKPGRIFIHILPGFAGTDISTPPVAQKVTNCMDVFTKRPAAYQQAANGSVHVTGLDRQRHPADTVICLWTKAR